MTTSEQLEREAETARTQITATLDELRTRMTPGQVVDQLVDYVRNGSGATFVGNFRRQVVHNPLPVTLVGAGLAWLAMASRRPPVGGRDFADLSPAAGETATEAAETARNTAAGAGERARAAAGRWTEKASGVANDWAEQTRSTASDWAEQTRSAASQFGARTSESGARLQDTAGSAAAAVNQAASAAYGAAAQGSRQGAAMLGRAAGTLSDAAGTLSETATASGRTVMDFLKERPLVLAGVGLALGALLGASLPGTEAEDRLMGEASDATKSEAKEFAEEQADRGKAVGQEALSTASRAFEQQLDQHGGGQAGAQQGSQSEAGRREAGTQMRAQAPTAAHTEVGHEASLVPSHDGAKESENRGASGEREHPAE